MSWNFEKLELRFSKDFVKEFRKLNARDQAWVKSKMKLIDQKSLNPNIKKLRNYPLGTYRLRLGKFRLIFDRLEAGDVLLFTTIKDRKDLY